MPQSRTLVVVLLLLTLAGATWLWSSGTRTPTATPPAPAGNHAQADGERGSAIGTAEATPNVADANTRTAAPPRSATLAADKGTLTVTVTWPAPAAAASRQKVPARGVMIYLRREQQRMPFTAVAQALTDENGMAEFRGVSLGPAGLQSDRGDRKKLKVVAGKQNVTFDLLGGIAVRGTVTDPAGHRIAAAGIWLQTLGTDWHRGRLIAATADDGTFAIEQIDPGVSLGAVASGFAPSKLVDLDVVETSKPPAVVHLELQPSGGQLTGTVTDGAGEPIGGALVAAGKRPKFPDSQGDRDIEVWTTRTSETDDDGQFTLDGLAAGTQPVAVRAHGHGLWRATVEIVADKTTVIAPQLHQSAVITGTVTDGEGTPVAAAAIKAYDHKPSTRFLSAGQIDFHETFSYRGAIADAAGRFRLEGVTPGTVHLFAQRNQPSHRGISVAYTQTQMTVAPGSDNEWHPVLTNGRTIAGRVLYKDGFPMNMVFLTLTDERDGTRHKMTSSDQGAFRFHCLGDSTYALSVQLWDAPKGTPPLQTTGIIPNRGPVELRATFDKPVRQKSGTVVGRIDDVAGRIRNLKAATVTLRSKQMGYYESRITNGAFRFDDVMPGQFRLALVEDGNSLAASKEAGGEWLELQPAETLDAGVLRTEPSGTVQLLVTREPGTEAIEPTIYVRAESGYGLGVKLGRKTECTAENLTPGNYKVAAYADGMLPMLGNVLVTAKATTKLLLTMRAGAACRISVWWPDGKTSARRSYRITDADGKVFREFESRLGSASTRPNVTSVNLPIGHWTIDFATSDGLKGQAVFDVLSVTDEVPVRVDLK